MAATVNNFGGGGMVSDSADISASVSGRTVSTITGYVARAGKIALLRLEFSFSGTAIAANTQIGTVPEGFLPVRTMEAFSGQQDYSNSGIRIDASGAIYTIRAVETYFSFHGAYIVA